jgi:hypothetical protein
LHRLSKCSTIKPKQFWGLIWLREAASDFASFSLSSFLCRESPRAQHPSFLDCHENERIHTWRHWVQPLMTAVLSEGCFVPGFSTKGHWPGDFVHCQSGREEVGGVTGVLWVEQLSTSCRAQDGWPHQGPWSSSQGARSSSPSLELQEESLSNLLEL